MGTALISAIKYGIDLVARASVALKVSKSGDTMTGQLTLPGGGLGSQAITYAEAFALATGTAGLLQNYNISTTVGGTPAVGTIRYNNATQVSATELLMAVVTSDGLDLTNFIAQMAIGDTFYIQQETSSANYQRWQATAAPVIGGGYATIAVTLLSSAGTGTTNFADALPIIIYGKSASAPMNTDALAEGVLNLYFTESRVLGTDLAGWTVGANSTVLATDTITQAIGKLQGQTDAINAVKTPITVSGSRALADSDHEHLLLVTGAYTLTANSGLRADFRCRVQQTSASQVTFANGTATFRNSYGIGANAKTAAQYATAYIEPGPSSTELAIIGDITA